jgi:hypothetical protein
VDNPVPPPIATTRKDDRPGGVVNAASGRNELLGMTGILLRLPFTELPDTEAQ